MAPSKFVSRNNDKSLVSTPINLECKTLSDGVKLISNVKRKQTKSYLNASLDLLHTSM